MNWKKQSREIGKALAGVAMVCGWFFGLRLAEMFFYDETLELWRSGSWIANLVLSIAGGGCGLSIWFI